MQPAFSESRTPPSSERKKPAFNEKKTTQLAAMLLKLRGGEMSYMKLIKLMYLVDRTALIRWGRPVTYDTYFSMKHGPVLSATLDRISEEVIPWWPAPIWNRCISKASEYEVKIVEDPGNDELSEAEENLIQEIFDEHGHKGRWDIVKMLHEILPEWKDPGESALPITYRDILIAGGNSESEAEAIQEELEGLALLERFFA